MSKRILHASGDPPRWTVREHRFVCLLAALALLLVSAPLVRALGAGRHPMLGGIVFTVAFAAMLLAAVFAVGRSRRSNLLALLLAIPVIVLQVVRVWRESDSVTIAAHVVGILFLFYTVVLILKFVFTSRRINSDIICASLCVYLLLGILCAVAYSLFYYLDPTSFVFALGEDGGADVMRFGGERTFIAIYYSFVTMSTLGYGDIVPTSSLARTCAALQAVVGQLYLAVLVARLVGLHIVHSAATSPTEPRDSGVNESRATPRRPC